MSRIVTEYHDGLGRSWLRVAHRIREIISVCDDLDREWPGEAIIDSIDYCVGEDPCAIAFASPLQDGTRNVRIVYETDEEVAL